MKRFLSLMLAIFIMVSAVSTFAAEPEKSQLDELKELGILTGDPDGNLRLEDTITRAEAVKMIIAAQNLSSISTFEEQKSKFPDVWETHWAKIYINMAKNMGIVEGDENGNFNPDSEVTNEELVKMLVNLLGYTPMADATGGYPGGYITTAARFGVTEGLTLKLNTPATRGDAAIMFANSLEIPLMVQTSWNAKTGDVEYMILDGISVRRATIKTEYFGINE